MRPVAIISLILVVCVYLVLRADPTHEENTAMSGGETAIQKNNPSDSSSASSQVRAEPESEQADSSMTGIDASTTPANTDTNDVIIIGTYKDPDDSNPLDPEDREPISIGVVLDADNDESWPRRENVTPISKGDFVDVSALGYADSAEGREVISIGKPLDVERFLAGEYNDLSTEDNTPISIGEKIEVPD